MTTETGGAAAPLGRAMADLDAAIDSALVVLTGAIEPAELAAAVGEVIAIRNRFHALVSEYFSQLETSGVLAPVGVRSAPEFVAQQTSADPVSVRNDSQRGRWLRDHPTLAAAFSTGAISGAHLDLIRRATIPADMSQADEVRLIDAARHSSFAEFQRAVQTSPR